MCPILAQALWKVPGFFYFSQPCKVGVVLFYEEESEAQKGYKVYPGSHLQGYKNLFKE